MEVSGGTFRTGGGTGPSGAVNVVRKQPDGYSYFKQ